MSKKEDEELALDFDVLKEHTKNFFVRMLRQEPDEKLLVQDPDLFPFFYIMFNNLGKDLIHDSIILKTGCKIDVNLPVVVFVLRPNPKLVRIMVDIINKDEKEIKYLAFFFPRCTIVCKSILEKGNVLSKVKVYELPYELIPLEKDLLTLDDETSFGDLILERNFTSLTMVKCSIQRLEAVFGKIPSKSAKGAWSCSILNALKKKVEDEGVKEPIIDDLILLDRTVDLVTPLLTPMTYEGIIDEFYPIKTGVVKVKEKAIKPETETPEAIRTLLLFNKDNIMFESMRDLHFNVVNNVVTKKCDELKALTNDKAKAKTLAEMTEYLRKINAMEPRKLISLFNIDLNLMYHLDSMVNEQEFKQLLDLETSIVSAYEWHNKVVTLLEKEIPMFNDPSRVLRIICLLSLTGDGLEKENYNALAKMFIAKFGIKESLRLINLERAGLFKKKVQESVIKSFFSASKEPQWWKIKATYNLMPENVNLQKPEDIDYTYTNFAPLSIRLIQAYLNNYWENPESNL